LVVIGSAVLLVAVMAGLRPHLVTGVAQAAPVPGPPAVGECVVDPLPAPKFGVVAPVTAASGGTVPVYPSQQIQPCTGARYGEITAVIAAPKPTVVRGDDADGRFLDDPNKDSCFDPAQQYLGMMTTQSTQSSGRWRSCSSPWRYPDPRHGSRRPGSGGRRASWPSRSLSSPRLPPVWQFSA